MLENTLGLTHERVICPRNRLHFKERAPLTELKKYVLCEGGGNSQTKPGIRVCPWFVGEIKKNFPESAYRTVLSSVVLKR